MLRLRKIVCAVDFSDASRLALQDAAELAARFEGDVTLVHVEEPAPFTGVDLLAASSGAAELRAAELERSLARWRAEAARLSGRPAHSQLLSGAPVAELVRFAETHGADLVVVGTHGRGGLERFVLGSVAEAVARRAPCPVLLARPRQQAESDDVAEEAKQYASS
jgi:nucleotide-binding universal stress UspA family protein